MVKETHIHDVLVVGAGISGATAAALLAPAPCDVLLLEARKKQDQQQCTDWLNPHAKTILEDAAVPTNELLREPIRRCVFYSADFSKSIEPALPEEPAYVVDCARLVRAMLKQFQAGKYGRFEDQAEVRLVEPGEEVVTVSLADGRRFAGKLLLIATGERAQLVEQVGLSVNPSLEEALRAASYRCPGGEYAEAGRMDYVLGLGGSGGIGYRMSRDGSLTVGVCVDSSSADAVEHLRQVSTRFQQQALLPAHWPEYAEGASPVRSPAGLSLVMESHVAKRTLVIGQAGGFIASYTNEGIYPCMWSAKLASGVVVEALRSSNPQDKLRKFETLWRTELASHLSPPNADAQSILPLVFSSQQMADKMLKSFHLGTSF